MKFEDDPLPYFLLFIIGLTWIIFPFVIMYRLKKIHHHLDRAEQRATAAWQADHREPQYHESPEHPA